MVHGKTYLATHKKFCYPTKEKFKPTNSSFVCDGIKHKSQKVGVPLKTHNPYLDKKTIDHTQIFLQTFFPNTMTSTLVLVFYWPSYNN